MSTSKILIIDDNGHNGFLLVHFCRMHAPDWQVLWFRVIDGTPDQPEGLPDNITYSVINNQTAAANAIRQNAGDDFIVFYDLQLRGVQEDTQDARDSMLTEALRELMNDSERRMLVNVHSADNNSSQIAPMIDESNERVLFMDAVTGKSDQEVEKIVAATVDKWNRLYLRQSLGGDQFISAMEMMTHEQIQNYPTFLKTRKAAEGIEEEELRRKRPDPAYLLRSYFGMDAGEFEQNFCNHTKALKGEVIEALKSISGLYSLDTKTNLGRPLSWSGAWLLALGVFRELQPRDKWREIFTVDDLRGAQQDGAQQKWPSIHAMQQPLRRGETVRSFVKMTRVLFTKKGTTDQSVLEKVELRATPPTKLSFKLSFPCVGGGADQTESLLDRLVGHVDHALAVAEGRAVECSGEGRDTSRAIWRFFLSASICDSKADVGRPGYGLAGGFSPMNILSIEKNTKTEVLWLN